MARKPVSSKPSTRTTKAAPTARTGVRNSPLPRNASNAAASKAAAPQRQITREMIAKRAYEISQSRSGGSEMDNWLRAERELHG